ncbi:unnamed protein product [Rotaria sp. Silwood2]|nr:unnamed protein product [Rotaria sp. Silwood2]CAF4628453.1 unnamed protein product [Rotaria sp. Silwood2]
MSIDLNNLSDGVLSYCNDRLYKFIEENLGIDEMMVIKMQSINSVRTLINVPDIIAFLSFNSKEIIELKSRICFIDEDNKRFMVKAGIQTNIDNLISVLKDKRKKQTKRRKTSKLSSQSSIQLNGDLFNASASNMSNSASIDSQLTLVFSTTPKINSPSYYIQKISDSIEKFCVNTFEKFILSNLVDYEIHVNILDADINGCIKCGCNTTIKIVFRSKSNSFQLSAYLKHLKNSRCTMIKKKKQGFDKLSSINNNLSNFVLQDDDNSNTNNIQNVSDEKNLDDEDSSFSTMINSSIKTSSNSSTKKRSLSPRSISSITKKTRSL